MAVGGFGNLQLDRDVGTGLGSFMKGYRDTGDFITGIRMNRERGNLASALESGDYNKAIQIAMNAGDTGLAQQLSEIRSAENYRQGQLNESRLDRQFNREKLQQELAQRQAEAEAERQYYLDQLGIRRDELSGEQAYRQGQLDLQRAGLEQDASKLAQQQAENEAQRAYLMNKLGVDTELARGDQDIRRAQLEQTGAYNTAKLAQDRDLSNARLAQDQARLDNEIQQQKAVSDYYSGRNIDYSKLPVSVLKDMAEKQEKTKEQNKSLNTITNMRASLEDIGTRFDEDFANIDEMQKGSTRIGRLRTSLSLFPTTEEKLARDQFNAWKGSMKNVLVNANRQAGTGAMSDADAERFEQSIGKAKTPAEARVILDSFYSRMFNQPLPNSGVGTMAQDVDKQKQADDILNKLKARKAQ